MMPLSSHLRLEVFVRVNGGFQPPSYFIYTIPSGFLATRSTSNSTGSKVARSVFYK
jgi:hypothetical protein